MDDFLPVRVPPLSRRDAVIALAIFCVVFQLLVHSPVRYMGDSRYTLLLTNTLLTKGSFILDDPAIPHKPTLGYRDTQFDGDTYQIEIVDGHFYYYFPPGSSILSAPFRADRQRPGSLDLHEPRLRRRPGSQPTRLHRLPFDGGAGGHFLLHRAPAPAGGMERRHRAGRRAGHAGLEHGLAGSLGAHLGDRAAGRRALRAARRGHRTTASAPGPAGDAVVLDVLRPSHQQPLHHRDQRLSAHPPPGDFPSGTRRPGPPGLPASRPIPGAIFTSCCPTTTRLAA